jgi:hypothetical protein
MGFDFAEESSFLSLTKFLSASGTGMAGEGHRYKDVREWPEEARKIMGIFIFPCS